MFYILISQNKESLYHMNERIEKLGYEEKSNYKLVGKEVKKEEPIRHTICTYRGCNTEVVAEYQTKEDCVKVLEIIAFAIKNGNGNIVFQLPAQEELQDMWETCKQLQEMLNNVATGTLDGLKELSEALKD